MTLLIILISLVGLYDQDGPAFKSASGVVVDPPDRPCPSAWCDSLYTVTTLYDSASATTYQLTEIKAANIQLKMAIANQVEGETGTEFVKRMGCCIAFNGSMGIKNLPNGVRQPVGIQIVDGKIIQDLRTKRYTLGIKENNQLVCYPPEYTAADILKDGTDFALTAFTPLIQNHRPVSMEILKTVPNQLLKHPRQAIAQYDNGNILVLSCGGRGFGGEGMTTLDLIRIFSELDVRFAFNLDGGGSTTTILNGKRITPLIDNKGTVERPRPNWLYVACEQ